MFHVKLSLCALMVLAAMATALPVHAEASGPGDGTPSPDPAAIAKRCIHQVTQKAERCVKHNRYIARHTVNLIENLLDQGHEEHAKRVAQNAVQDIQRASNHCVDSIQVDCRECIAVLNRLHAHRLAYRVHEACEDLVAGVRRGEHAAIKAIRAAFDEDPSID